jgi:hypothetical protein
MIHIRKIEIVRFFVKIKRKQKVWFDSVEKINDFLDQVNKS